MAARPTRGAPETFDYHAKICVVGDSGVGKSSVLRRYVDDVYDASYVTTIGVDFYIGSLKHENSTVKLQLWDTAGQERFSTVVSTYYRGSHAVCVVFDTTCRETFSHVPKWVASVRAHVLDPATPIALVGTKADAGASRAVSAEEAAACAAQLGLLGYYETSARTPAVDNDAIFTLFAAVVAAVVRRSAAPQLAPPRTAGAVDLGGGVKVPGGVEAGGGGCLRMLLRGLGW